MMTEPDGVNFNALLRRFSRICLIFCRSERTGGSRVPIWDSTLMFERRMIGSSSDITSSMRSGTPNFVMFSGMRPASMRVMSRMSLISASRCRAFESIRERLLRCGSVTCPVTLCSSMCV